MAITALAVILLVFTLSSVYRNLDSLSVDLLLAARYALFEPQSNPDQSNVVVVALDEKTYKTAPFKDTPKVLWTPYLAKAQDKILAAGAKVIGYDLIYPTSISEFAPDHEKPFLISLLKAARENRVVLGKAQHGQDPVMPHKSQQAMVRGDRNIRSLNVEVDGDDIIRRVPLGFDKADGNFETSFSYELFKRFSTNESQASFSRAPLLNFQGGASIPTYSLVDLHHCLDSDDYFADQFKDKVVLFGGVLDIEDRKLTSKRYMTGNGSAFYMPDCQDNSTLSSLQSRRDTIAGVYIHATAINNFINNDFLAELSVVQKNALVIGAGILTGLISLFVGSIASAVLSLTLLTLVAVSGVMLIQQNWVIPVLPVLLAIVLSYLVIVVFKYVVVERQRSYVKNLFGLYLEPHLVDQMMQSEKLPELGGEERVVTAWFADLADFTTISEGLSPTELIALMNLYFKTVTDIIEAHGGFVVQYVGDEVYAVFGALADDPHAPGHAVAAAFQVQNKLHELNTEGAFGGKTVTARIGINRGNAIVGNVGSSRRFNFAIMGDTVNLGSRLEGANKVMNTQILISESVADNLPASIAVREVATLQVKGKEEPCRVFEPFYIQAERFQSRLHQDADKKASYPRTMQDALPAAVSRMSEDFSAAQQFMKNRQFQEAIDTLIIYANDPVAEKIIERARELMNSADDWQGVVSLKTK